MDKEIDKASQILKKGGLVIFPSDTVYGLLVDATNQKACEKLIEFKARPFGKPISVFVSDFDMLSELVEISEKQEKILKEILPGPFTVVLKSKHKVCQLLESEKGTLGIRLPINGFIEKLTANFKKPITATSANLSGNPANYSVESLFRRLSKEKRQLIDFVFDVGKLPYNKPSTVIDLTEFEIKVLREGELGLKKIGNYFSQSPDQTKKISKFVLQKNLNQIKNKPLFFIIKGDLGVGKTIFIKGIGEYLGIKNIISPSYVIYYEYWILTHFIGKLVHIDLYNIEEKEEFSDLKLERYFKPNHIICFEWGEKAGEIYERLEKMGQVVFIEMRYISETEREIIVNKAPSPIC